MPRAMTYVRTSEEIGDVEQSLFEVYAASYRMYEWGGHYQDPVQLATTPFVQRPAGNKLMCDTQRGDIVIFPNFTLAFANMNDLHLVLRTWGLKGITAYFHAIDLTFSQQETGAYEFLTELVEFEKEMVAWTCPVEVTNDLIWAIAYPMKQRGLTHEKIAAELNKQNIRTVNGCTWTLHTMRNWYHRNSKTRRPAPAAV